MNFLEKNVFSKKIIIFRRLCKGSFRFCGQEHFGNSKSDGSGPEKQIDGSNKHERTQLPVGRKYTQNEWGRFQSTLETGGEDLKLHSKRVDLDHIRYFQSR